MRSNKQQRKVSTFVSTVTYWLVLAAFGAAIVASMIVVVRSGQDAVGLVGLVAALVLAAGGISYGLSMRSRKQAPSR